MINAISGVLLSTCHDVLKYLQYCGSTDVQNDGTSL